MSRSSSGRFSKLGSKYVTGLENIRGCILILVHSSLPISSLINPSSSARNSTNAIVLLRQSLFHQFFPCFLLDECCLLGSGIRFSPSAVNQMCELMTKHLSGNIFALPEIPKCQCFSFCLPTRRILLNLSFSRMPFLSQKEILFDIS